MDAAVAITGMGFLTSLGDTPELLWSRLIQGQCAAQHWDDLAQENFRVAVACRIRDFEAPTDRRAESLGVAAATAAVADAALQSTHRLGLFLGSTMGESAVFERAAESALALPTRDGSVAALTTAVASAVGAPAILRSYANACAAGNTAIGAAVSLLQRDMIDVAVAGGVDGFSRIAMAGFVRSRAMTPNVCRPFDAGRAGMQLAEGAAFLVLERTADARARGANIVAGVHGTSLCCDAYHPIAPAPNGEGMMMAMRRSLALAGASPTDLAFISAHGSGTTASDAVEAFAIHEVAGAVPVAGWKGALGHAMGAASAIEAVISALALRHRQVPGTTNSRTLDPHMQINLVLEPQALSDRRFVISNAFGFGGINSSLLLEAA
jgi:3-oxoacyl-[acyl-carrier-protein] synthase II